METRIENLRQLLKRYKSLAVTKGSEFLLSPENALHLADDLARINVGVWGLDGWYYIDREKGWIVQDLTADFSVDEKLLEQPETANMSLEAVKDFIKTQLPERIEFVSFTFNVPPTTKLW